MTRLAGAFAASLVLSACGDKLPESQAAKKMGDVPKQVIDKAHAETLKAAQQAEDRNKAAD